MQSTKTRQEYLKRMHNVIDFIETNLDADLSLETLAGKAHYSPFHFHKVFSLVVGERPNAFVKRKRIERIAAILLVQPNRPLMDLAYQYGFNSDSSFSRAFRKFYGVSPTAFKSKGGELLRKNGIEPFQHSEYIVAIEHKMKWLKMNAQIEIKELPEMDLAGMSHIGEFEKMPAMYQKVMGWAHQKQVLPARDFKAITIYHDNPHLTPLSKVRFSACVKVKGKIAADGEIRPVTLKKGIFVVGNFEIAGEDISKSWEYLCLWVIENGCQFRDGQYFEVYHNDHRTHPEQKFIIDICIPLEPTENVKSLGSRNIERTHFVDPVAPCETNMDYHALISYMKELKANFGRNYGGIFTFGKVYTGKAEYSYFALKVEELKKYKLKFALVLDVQRLCFSICLTGQNKGVRRKYWNLFRESDFDKYHLVDSIDDSLPIVEHEIVECPSFEDRVGLSALIERECMGFIEEVRAVLG